MALPEHYTKAVDALQQGHGPDAASLLVRAIKQPNLTRDEQFQLRTALAEAWFQQDVASAKALVAQRAAEWDLARQEFARVKDLKDSKVVSVQEVEQKENAVKVALALKEAAESQLATAELTVRRDVYTYDVLAWALFRNGQRAEAVPAIEKALSLNTPEPLFHQHAARIFESAGRGEEARRHRERAAALNPKFDIGTEVPN